MKKLTRNVKPDKPDEEHSESTKSSLRKSEEKKARNNLSNIARENHCEIERKRRERIYYYMSVLKDKIPKLRNQRSDKFKILQAATEYIEELKINTPDNNFFLTNDEIINLIQEATQGFHFVINCSTGQIIYVSQSVTTVLNCSKNDWLNLSFYDKIHAEDIEKVKEHLFIEKKPFFHIRRGQNTNENMKRNFICRMKIGDYNPEFKTQNELGEKNYIHIRCIGFIKQYSNNTPTVGSKNGQDILIAIGKIQPAYFNPRGTLSKSEFVTRHEINSNCNFVDERIMKLLGYLPIDLLGKMYYDFFHPEDKSRIIDSFKQAVSLKGQVVNTNARIKSKIKDWEMLKLSLYAFINPYSEEIEFILCTNTVIPNIKNTEIEKKFSDMNIKGDVQNQQNICDPNQYYYYTENSTGKKYLVVDYYRKKSEKNGVENKEKPCTITSEDQQQNSESQLNTNENLENRSNFDSVSNNIASCSKANDWGPNTKDWTKLEYTHSTEKDNAYSLNFFDEPFEETNIKNETPDLKEKNTDFNNEAPINFTEADLNSLKDLMDIISCEF